MMLICYPKLSTRSRRALLRTKGRFGKRYCYSPRGDLLYRLSIELNLTVNQVYDQLMAERKYLLDEANKTLL